MYHHQFIKNNVHVSGTVMSERVIDKNLVEVVVGINTSGMLLPVLTVIEYADWEKFKTSFPQKYTSVTISGHLQSNKIDAETIYSIKANGVYCFHNILGESLDETETLFHGRVKLRKKFEFDTESKLFLKRLIFETISNERPAIIEAMALRKTAPYFDSVREGDELILKANYVIDKNGNPPYWKIKHQPEIVM